ncbi:MAG: response regulator [Proteobacteria bacterium]|nr:response regulator [Pseudomonadota bacterium]MBU1388356.1 response regulator [Pseudomonadota bacterium]MBU1542820.1 response regulator [Pseudomonadota bacterium]MBU2481848.1 response regulator [Pseudomonadota bacterium]
MIQFNEHIDILINAYKSSIEQMTHLKVTGSETRQTLKEKNVLQLAHIISYTDYDNTVEGEFVLTFNSVQDALKLASAIAQRLGMGKLTEVGDDSTDLLNEFLNVVVGRTISDWDSIGLKVKFGTPVYKKNYKSAGSKSLQGYIITLDVAGAADKSAEQIILRVFFDEKTENNIKGKKILLVDDSRVMRNIISQVLVAEGAMIKEAENGEMGARVYRTFNPHLTLMDINMPEMGGFEAIEKIRAFDANSKFIILSSSSRKDEIIKAKQLKVSGYLVKPVEPDQLIERVSSVLG